MKVELSDKIIQEIIEAQIIQTNGSMYSSESRGQQVQRMTYHIGEYIIAVIGKEMKNRKMLPPPQKHG